MQVHFAVLYARDFTKHGYVATFVKGEIRQEHGMVTDARPGKVVQEIDLPFRAERSP